MTIWPHSVFHKYETMTVDMHIGKHSILGNLCLPLLEKWGRSQGISCGLESGHPGHTQIEPLSHRVSAIPIVYPVIRYHDNVDVMHSYRSARSRPIVFVLRDL